MNSERNLRNIFGHAIWAAAINHGAVLDSSADDDDAADNDEGDTQPTEITTT